MYTVIINCNFSSDLTFFIKRYYPDVYKKYVKDLFLEKINNKEKSIELEIKKDLNIDLKELIKDFKIQKVEDVNFAYDYLKNRKLEKYSNKFMYIENFMGFYNKINNYENKSTYDPRLIIPFIKNDTKEIYALQGRSLFGQSPKYLTIILNNKYEKLYNYYNINKNKRIYFTEGPIDSLFLPNSFAISRAKMNLNLLKNIKLFKDLVFVPDTDFIYNYEIKKNIKEFIKIGIKIYIPPKKYEKYKDINDLIISGLSEIEVKQLIDSNIYEGILALAKLSKYKIKKDIL